MSFSLKWLKIDSHVGSGFRGLLRLIFLAVFHLTHKVRFNSGLTCPVVGLRIFSFFFFLVICSVWKNIWSHKYFTFCYWQTEARNQGDSLKFGISVLLLFYQTKDRKISIQKTGFNRCNKSWDDCKFGGKSIKMLEKPWLKLPVGHCIQLSNLNRFNEELCDTMISSKVTCWEVYGVWGE